MKHDVVVVDEDGYGKRISSKSIRKTNRGAKGVKVSSKDSVEFLTEHVSKKSDKVLLVTDDASVVRISAKDIPKQTRNTRGVKLIDVAKGHKVTDIVVC